ncbi:unnamed protein product [Trypanosoma congolense IL3000]|nr:unnamed protein product [Trypanosoma congolense IL3000]
MRQPGGPDELHKLLLERVEELKYWKMWGVEQERNISSFKKALMMWPEIQWGPRPRTEVAREKFKCPYCDKTCQNVGWLKRHIRTRHSLKSESDVDAAADDPRLQCPYCGTAYGSVGWLKRHIQEKHARTPQLPYRDAGNVGVNCFLCNVTCGTADGLVRHVHARHSSGSGSSAKKVADALRLECPYCNKTYAISGWRKRHVQKRHAEKLQASYQDAVDDFLTCPVCPASRSTCGELWEHIRKEHRLGQWEEDMDSDMSL